LYIRRDEKERNMFGLRKKGPDKAFSHTADCKIVKAQGGDEIPWSEIESGHWQAVCQCGSEDFYEVADRRTRLDPLDPSTFRHVGQCEHRDTTDPAVVRTILKVKDGMGEGYWWVTCGACDTSWQVPHYAAESVG
jgi:hypothetical protein